MKLLPKISLAISLSLVCFGLVMSSCHKENKPFEGMREKDKPKQEDKVVKDKKQRSYALLLFDPTPRLSILSKENKLSIDLVTEHNPELKDCLSLGHKGKLQHIGSDYYIISQRERIEPMVDNPNHSPYGTITILDAKTYKVKKQIPYTAFNKEAKVFDSSWPDELFMLDKDKLYAIYRTINRTDIISTQTGRRLAKGVEALKGLRLTKCSVWHNRLYALEHWTKLISWDGKAIQVTEHNVGGAIERLIYINEDYAYLQLKDKRLAIYDIKENRLAFEPFVIEGKRLLSAYYDGVRYVYYINNKHRHIVRRIDLQDKKGISHIFCRLDLNNSDEMSGQTIFYYEPEEEVLYTSYINAVDKGRIELFEQTEKVLSREGAKSLQMLAIANMESPKYWLKEFEGDGSTAQNKEKTIVENAVLISWGNNKEKHIKLAENVRELAVSVFFHNRAIERFTASKLKSIEAKAFFACRSLEQVDIPNIEVLKTQAFKGCSKLKNVTVTKLPDTYFDAFEGTPEAKNLIIQEAGFNKEKAEEWAVRHGFATINGVRLGEEAPPKMPRYLAFKGHTITKVIRNFSKEIPTRIEIPEYFTEIGEEAFEDLQKTNFGEVIGLGIKKLGKNAFARNTNITEISFPKLEVLEDRAFYACRYRTEEIRLPSARKLGDEVFAQSNYLTILELPKLEEAGANILDGCIRLERLRLGAKPPTKPLSYGGFSKWGCTLEIPKGSKPLYEAWGEVKKFSRIVEY